MKKSDVFPSDYLKADELDGDVTYTIASVNNETLGQGKDAKQKPVVYFSEIEKGLVLNVTNWNVIEQQHGAESDDWTGKRITIYPAEVEFKGDMVMGIRVRLRAVGAQSRNAPPAPTGNGNGAAAKPAAEVAMNHAKRAFAASMPGSPPEGIKAEFFNACRDYIPGKASELWTAQEWERFIADKFIRQHSPIGGDSVFQEADIPF